jgi:uncharacterized protein
MVRPIDSAAGLPGQKQHLPYRHGLRGRIALWDAFEALSRELTTKRGSMESATQPRRQMAEPATPDAERLAPVTRGERIDSLDFIRGIAVLGILLANITVFAHSSLAVIHPQAMPGGGTLADRVIWLAQFILIDGKFRALFTLLFGAGLCLFMDRAAERGGAALQARRLFWLLLFGLAHGVLLFEGDILVTYAVGGSMVLLLGFHVRTAQQQMVLGLTWYVIGSLVVAGIFGFQYMAESNAASMPDAYGQLRDAWDAQARRIEGEAAVRGAGSYPAIVAQAWGGIGSALTSHVFFGLLESAPLMLVGMALYRVGFFEGALSDRAMRAWGWAGLVGGGDCFAALGWWAWSNGFPLFMTEFVFVGLAAFPRLPMALGMAALLVLASKRAMRGWLGTRLAQAGRVAFTNYIGTSLVMVLLFQGWAGGLHGGLSRAELLAAVALGWALMLTFSRLWLARYRYGPLEWLWRCLTYWRFFPIRR